MSKRKKNKTVKVYPVWRADTGKYVLRWKDETGEWKQKTTALDNRRRHEADAGQLADELSEELTRTKRAKSLLGGIDPATAGDWDVACGIFERNHICKLTPKSQQAWSTTRRSFEEVIHPESIHDITTATLAAYLTNLEVSAATKHTRMAWLRVALRWADRMDLIDKAPFVPMPKRGTEPTAKRAVFEQEFSKLLAAADKVRRPVGDAEQWKRFIRGLWHSGLRVDELLRLSWSDDAKIVLSRTGLVPMITFRKQKNRKSQTVPVLPEFWKAATENRRDTLVFPVPTRNTNAAIRVLSRIGKEAGIVTDPATGRTATSTDFGRRALPARLAKSLTAQQLAQLMRHSSIETTWRHYYRDSPEALGGEFWDDEK